MDGLAGIDGAEVVFSEAVDRIIARVENTPVPDGEYETNPLHSVPDLVKKVAKKYGISEDGAQLYLQLATLPFPSDVNIKRWNGWKKKQHDTAIAELVEKKLVLQAKRSRASRSVFVPGHWEPKQWDKADRKLEVQAPRLGR